MPCCKQDYDKSVVQSNVNLLSWPTRRVVSVVHLCGVKGHMLGSAEVNIFLVMSNGKSKEPLSEVQRIGGISDHTRGSVKVNQES